MHNVFENSHEDGAVMKEKKLLKIYANIHKMLSNPKRIEIISALQDREKTGTELVRLLGIQKANVSQYLNVMSLHGIVEGRRDGQKVYYSINPKWAQAYSHIKEAINVLMGNKI